MIKYAFLAIAALSTSAIFYGNFSYSKQQLQFYALVGTCVHDVVAHARQAQQDALRQRQAEQERIEREEREQQATQRHRDRVHDTVRRRLFN